MKDRRKLKKWLREVANHCYRVKRAKMRVRKGDKKNG